VSLSGLRVFRHHRCKVHALVGYGKIGKAKAIQRWRCQACGTTFSCRRGTPLYYLKSDPAQINMVLWFLTEGVDISVLVRYTGRSEATVARWLARAGQQSERWHQVLFVGLSLALVQMDELYVRIRGMGERGWLWLAMDPLSKAIPSLQLGGRKAEDAYALVHDLKHRLQPDCVPAFSTDGLRSYFYALTAHFGRWYQAAGDKVAHWQVEAALLYGQLVKRRERRHVVFTTMRMLLGKRADLTKVQEAHGLSDCIQTAFVERLNLTLRQMIAPLTRKTWSLAYSPTHLLLHLEWGRFYYHFLRPHRSLHQRTPAMALHLTDHVWTIAEFTSTPLIISSQGRSLPRGRHHRSPNPKHAFHSVIFFINLYL
jgi:transposase-like protein/IS1 family transposase